MRKLIAIFLFVAAHHAPAFAQETPEDLRNDYMDAFFAEDVAAASRLYHDEAYLYGPDGYVTHGQDDIAKGMKAFFDAFDDIQGSFQKHGQMRDGKHAAAWGLWEMSATPVAGGDRLEWKGRFLDVFIKTDEGWRFLADHASYSAPE